MVDLLASLKPQMDALNQMYKAGYDAGIAEGRRQAHAEFAVELQKIQEGSKP